MRGCALGLLLLFVLVTIVCLPFIVQPSMASSTIYIRADGSIDPGTAPIMTIDNITYTFTGNIDDEIVIEKSNSIIDCDGYLVEGNGAGNGFTLYSVANVTIRNANIRNFTYGIYLESASYNFIHGNNISANGYDGIEIYFSSDNNKISDNKIETSEWFGIGIYYSNNNSITENKIINNSYGIWLYNALENTISMNDISANTESGIEPHSSSNNAIFHNNFLDNTNQVVSDGSVNVWDDGYPSGGNYWDDYSGVDVNGDGIGDTARPIDVNNQDRYPLMEPWTNVAIVSLTLPRNVTAKGSTLLIKVTVQNQGFTSATINVTAYANTTQIQTVLAPLVGRESVALTLTWNTSEFARAYDLTVNASRAQGEIDLSDNTKVYSVVKVSCIGDINGDYATDAKDFVLVKKAIPSFPGSPKWNPNADINNDLVIDGKDYQIVKTHIPTILP